MRKKYRINKKRKSVVGDSIVKNLSGRDISWSDSVKTRSNPGSTSNDIMTISSQLCQKDMSITTLEPTIFWTILVLLKKQKRL